MSESKPATLTKQNQSVGANKTEITNEHEKSASINIKRFSMDNW